MNNIKVSLKDYYKEIVDCMLYDPEIGEDEYATNNFYFSSDDGSLNVEGRFNMAGSWTYDGDGYNLPYTCDLLGTYGYITELEATYYDEETDTEYKFPQREIDELEKYLDSVLEKSIA